MKLSEFKNEALRRYREVSNLVTHPWQFINKFIDRKSEEFIENTEFNWGSRKQELTQTHHNNVTKKNKRLSQLNSSLQSGQTVKSNRGAIYTIEEIILLEERECLYTAKNSSSESVWIKEYKLLEGDFNQQEINKRQQDFQRLVNLNLKIGHGQDFRIVKLIDVFYKDKSCFLITKIISNSVTLREDLIKNGSMTNEQIREVIKQVLESLLFLHTYRVRFSKDKLEEREGLPHGNINPNSLLIKYTHSSIVPDERRFFIYLSDLALWKHVVSPPGSQLYRQTIAKTSQDLGSFREDLYYLGRLALVLASGKYDESSWQTIDSEAEQILSSLKNDKVKNFISRLLNQKLSLEAEEALDEIIKLDFRNSQAQTHVEEQLTQEENSQPEQILKKPGKQDSLLLRWIVFGSLASILLFFIVWTFSTIDRNNLLLTKTPKQGTDPNCCIKSIRGKYVVESTWEAIDSSMYDSNIKTSLAKKLGEYTKGFNSRQEIIEKIQYDKNVNFALMRISDEIEKKGLVQSPKLLAYDALVIFVAFKYSASSNKDTPAKILDGQIKEKEISELYTTSHLKRLQEKYQSKKIVLYFPKDKDTVNILQEFIAKNIHTNIEKNDAIANFQKTIKQATKERRIFDSKILFQKVQNDAKGLNDSTIAIGIDRLSRLFGQCSVYPLAIVTEKNQQGVQLIKLANMRDLSHDDENVDLCNDKGSYWQSVKDYPLAYPLGVVYKKENEENKKLGEEFAEQMLTDEAQYLLSQVGLVPIKPIPDIQKNLWNEQK